MRSLMLGVAMSALAALALMPDLNGG